VDAIGRKLVGRHVEKLPRYRAGRNDSSPADVDAGVIARTWRGWTRREDADAYLDYVERTGGRASRATPGNLGFYILRRDEGDRTEFVTMSLWESLDAIRAFAGDDLRLRHQYRL
jgi:heme-degrading monooxygenase HmoA